MIKIITFCLAILPLQMMAQNQSPCVDEAHQELLIQLNIRFEFLKGGISHAI